MLNRYLAHEIGGGGGRSKKWDSLDLFRNVKQFTGSSEEWMEFSFKLRGQVGAMNTEAAQILDYVETKMTEEELEGAPDDWEVELDEEMVKTDVLKDTSQKMYNILLNVTTGEANTVVRRCVGRNGLLAWKRLCATLNPRTLASGVKLISQVLNPQKITDARKADTAIETWAGKLVRLKTECGEELTYKLKLAVLYGMLPKDLQERTLDKCAINWGSTKEAEAMAIYGKVKEEVKNVAKSRRDMNTPKPMEVDKVYADWGYWEGPAAGTEENQENDENERLWRSTASTSSARARVKGSAGRAVSQAIGRQSAPRVKGRAEDGRAVGAKVGSKAAARTAATTTRAATTTAREARTGEKGTR